MLEHVENAEACVITEFYKAEVDSVCGKYVTRPGDFWHFLGGSPTRRVDGVLGLRTRAERRKLVRSGTVRAISLPLQPTPLRWN